MARSTGTTPARSGAAGLHVAIAAFEALRAASADEPDLRPGRDELPESEAAAHARARRIVEVLTAADVARPERLVQAVLTAHVNDAPRWHVAPLYAVRLGKRERLEAVADPFLSRSPLGLDEWMQQIGALGLTFLFPEHLLAHPTGVPKRRRNEHVTTRPRGTGTAADAHDLAKLLRAWLRQPDDAAPVGHFRALFGETAWRALASAYPKLARDVEAAVARLRPLT